jgi:drug/metabolite transporter (DMT)-like permease
VVYLGCTGLGTGVWRYIGMGVAAFCVLHSLATTVVLWGAWAVWGDGPLVPRGGRRFARAAVAAGVINGLGWIAWFFAFSRGPVAIVQTVTAMSSVVAAALAVIFLGERIVGRSRTIGIGLVIAASLLLGYVGEGSGERGQAGRAWLAASFVAAALWGANLALAKHAYGLPGAGDLRMNLGQWLGFMVTVLPYGLFLAPDEPWFPKGVGPTLGVVLLHVVGEIGLFAAIRRGPSALVNAIAGLYPVPSILFVGVVLGEWPHWLAWLGIALALAGIVLAVPSYGPPPAPPLAAMR